jgi:NADH dehydrogenase (ubiquinone) 1 beta subcomplex subunit 5
MGHKRTIQIIPTRYEWTKFKDHMNFYILLGIIPIGIIIGATNIFIGPAELIDIPEDYEPKYWEYYRHPISRFIARNLLTSEEKLYERHLHFMANEMERIEMRKLEEKVKLLISTRHDYKRWYYIPKLEEPVHITREFEEYNEEHSGQRG